LSQPSPGVPLVSDKKPISDPFAKYDNYDPIVSKPVGQGIGGDNLGGNNYIGGAGKSNIDDLLKKESGQVKGTFLDQIHQSNYQPTTVNTTSNANQSKLRQPMKMTVANTSSVPKASGGGGGMMAGLDELEELS